MKATTKIALDLSLVPIDLAAQINVVVALYDIGCCALYKELDFRADAPRREASQHHGRPLTSR